MAYLIRMPRAAGKRQPSGDPPINISHPLTRDLFAVAHKNKQGLALSSPLTLYGNTVVRGDWYGLGLLFNTTDSYAQTSTNFSPPTVVGSILCAFIPKTLNTFGLCGHELSLSYWGYSLFSHSGSSITLRIGSGGVLGPETRKSNVTANVLSLGRPVFIAFSVSTLDSVVAALNGRMTTLTASGTAASYNQGTLPFRIGSYSSGDAANVFGAKNIALLASWSRALTPAELMEVTANPWQLFKPRLARFISIPSTGPVIFKPYWARRRSLIIGSGV
jgi:hypothetical protein